LPDANTDPDALLVDSRAVLKAIESQHGLLTERATDIYSFSHLTFHEYFTAKSILEVSDPDAQKLALHRLADHAIEKRWREVFLLVVERMENADYLLTMMLERINAIVRGGKELQRFLNWVNEKAISVDTPYKPAAVRAFYSFFDLNDDDILRLACLLDPNLDIDIDQYIEVNIDLDRTLALALSRALYLDETISHPINIEDALHHTLGLDNELYTACSRSLTPKLQQELQALRDQLPTQLQNDGEQFIQLQDEEEFIQWCTTQGKAWVKQLRTTIIEHRNIGHDWRFSPEQQSKLRLYNNTNLLLAECLNRGYLSNEARQRIEDGMLMTIEQTKELGRF
jgi:hypothetical protein